MHHGTTLARSRTHAPTPHGRILVPSLPAVPWLLVPAARRPRKAPSSRRSGRPRRAAASSPHAVSSVAAAASSPALSSIAVSCAHELGARWWHPPRRRARRGPRPPMRQAVRRQRGKHGELNGGDVLTAQWWRQLACGPTPRCGADGSSAAAPLTLARTPPAVLSLLCPGSALLGGPALLVGARTAHRSGSVSSAARLRSAARWCASARGPHRSSGACAHGRWEGIWVISSLCYFGDRNLKRHVLWDGGSM
ncbi:hypothetical protein BS78_04G095600 [Paspalum vaginatum]|nr:hypothetical protein BS78_04G095600 [Paspalum vaginatum]